MYTNDMARKMSAAMEKVKKAIEAGYGKGGSGCRD